METAAEDILLVQLLPERGASAASRNGKEITDTLSELAFKEPLLKELEALEDLGPCAARRSCCRRSSAERSCACTDWRPRTRSQRSGTKARCTWTGHC